MLFRSLLDVDFQNTTFNLCNYFLQVVGICFNYHFLNVFLGQVKIYSGAYRNSVKSADLARLAITARIAGLHCGISSEVEKRLRDYQGSPITVAVMGCEVNGPAEAKHADVGLAFGVNQALLFVKGEIIAKISPEQYMEALFEQIDKIKLEKAMK